MNFICEQLQIYVIIIGIIQVHFINGTRLVV